MTKHIGPIIVLIVIAGIVLYAVRRYADLLDGISYIQRSFDTSAIEGLFK